MNEEEKLQQQARDSFGQTLGIYFGDHDGETRAKIESFLSAQIEKAYEAGRKFGNEENARIKNSGKTLYETGFKDARVAVLKEVEEIINYHRSTAPIFDDILEAIKSLEP